jgi:hypothetical protein
MGYTSDVTALTTLSSADLVSGLSDSIIKVWNLIDKTSKSNFTCPSGIASMMMK